MFVPSYFQRSNDVWHNTIFYFISDIVKMAEGGITGEGPDSHIIAGVIDGMRQSFIDSGLAGGRAGPCRHCEDWNFL
jgi:hypothetical protein